MKTKNKFHIKAIAILCSGFVVFLTYVLFTVLSLNSQVIEKSETNVETSAEPSAKAIEEKKDSVKHEYIGWDQCLTCHEDRDKSIRLTKHTILFKKVNKKSTNGCEACHGAGGAHAEDMENVLNFAPDADPAAGTAACLKCHRRGDVKNWDISDHADNDMNCVSCHQLHKPANKQLKAPQTELCATCHDEKKTEILMPGRHPIKEGKAACSQCHSPHGNFEMAYDGSSVTLSCAGCHQEKAGPFAFEHEPAAESCINCHQVHGSTNKKLLKFKVPELCIQCHTGQHDVPNAANNLDKKCTDCHTAPHGSNLDQGLLR